MSLRRGIAPLLLLLAFAAGCDRRAESSLNDIQAKLDAVVGRTPLGDFGAVAFDAPAQAEWFVLVPAGATAGQFKPESAFMKSVGEPPVDLLNLGEPSIALVNGGKVAEVQPLHKAYTVGEVLAKPGRTAHGLRFVRKAGEQRSYVILSLD